MTIRGSVLVSIGFVLAFSCTSLSAQLGKPLDRAIVTTFVTIPAAATASETPTPTAAAASKPTPTAAVECHPTGYATTKTGRVVTFHITTKTDRFSGVTTTQTNFLPIPGAEILNLYAWTHSNASREFGILIATESSGLRYASCRQTYLLADGKPVPITEVKHYSSKVIKPGSSERVGYAGRAGRLGFLGLGFDINTSPLLLELVGVNLSADALAQLAAASKIEFKVCNDEAVASPEFVQATRELGCIVGE